MPRHSRITIVETDYTPDFQPNAVPTRKIPYSGPSSEWSGVKTTFVKEETTTVSSKNLWKAMHSPKWEGVHPEPDAFFAMGKYNFAISMRRGIPKSLLSEIKPGDRIVVQPRTMFGKRGNPLKNPRAQPHFRFGTIITEPILEKDKKLNTCVRSPGTQLYGFRVVWDNSFVPIENHKNLKNNPCKTFTLIPT